MGCSPTINVLSYTLIEGSPKNKIMPYILVAISIFKEIIIVGDKCGYFLNKILKIKYRYSSVYSKFMS